MDTVNFKYIIMDDDFYFMLGKILFKSALVIKDFQDAVYVTDCPDENILMQKASKLWNQEDRFDRPDGLFVITNKRVAFLAHKQCMEYNKLIKTDFLSIPYEKIKEVQMSKIWHVVPALTLLIEDKKITFTFLSGKIEELVSTIKSYILSFSKEGKS